MLNLPIKLDPMDKRLAKRVSKYPPQVLQNLEYVARELEDPENELPPGRQEELVSGYDNVYSLRLSLGYRVAIEDFGNGRGRYVYADSHERFYEWLNRRS